MKISYTDARDMGYMGYLLVFKSKSMAYLATSHRT